MTEKNFFKVCPMCKEQWETLDDFLDDQSLDLNGYQAVFDDLGLGVFYFTHRREGCCSTMALRAGAFSSVYSGERYLERRTGMDDCPGYCLEKEQLSRCDAHCECAFNREVIQIIKKRQNKLKQSSK